MKNKSDNHVHVVSATEASRSFASLLDRVEEGERFVVERHGRRVCMLTPPLVESRLLSECIALLRQRPRVLLDDAFASDLEDIIAGEPPESRPWDS